MVEGEGRAARGAEWASPVPSDLLALRVECYIAVSLCVCVPWDNVWTVLDPGT